MSRLLLATMMAVTCSGCIFISPRITVEGQPLPRDSSQTLQVQPHTIAGLAPGTQVLLTENEDEIEKKIYGTVMQAGPNGVALMNCRIVRSNPPKYSTQPSEKDSTELGLESHVDRTPVQWVSIYQIASATIIAPATADFVGPQLDLNDQPIPIRAVDLPFTLSAAANSISIEPAK